MSARSLLEFRYAVGDSYKVGWKSVRGLLEGYLGRLVEIVVNTVRELILL